jgi:hypothetical protein
MNNEGDCFLTLAFLREGDDEPCMNRLTANISANKVFHVELGFQNNEFFSIVYGSPAHIRKRTISNKLYILRSFTVSNKQYKDCYALCVSLANQGVYFDNLGMYCSIVYKFLPCCLINCGSVEMSKIRSSFCSKIITQILQFIEVEEVRGMCPASTTPSDLLEVFKNSINATVSYTRFDNLNFKLAIPKIPRIK